ncbi:MAG TPA: SdpI family protein [Flavisolibacter sp.]|jgi:uncharacterized membrane protein|nr:SdpI family protein [Flavisolibacter sp.]
MKKIIFVNGAVILLALFPAAYLALTWPTFPQTVPLHFGADLKPDRFGNKEQMWLPVVIIAAVSLFVYFLFCNIHRIDPKRKEDGQLASFQKLATGLVIFLTALSLLIIRSATDNTISLRLLFPLLGLLFAFLGNALANVKPNYFAGFRLPWTLHNEENWRKTHALGSRLWTAGGLLIAIGCFFLPPVAATVFFGIMMMLMGLIPAVYSYRLFKKGT